MLFTERNENRTWSQVSYLLADTGRVAKWGGGVPITHHAHFFFLRTCNDSNHHRNFKRKKSRVKRYKNNKSRIRLLGQITPHAANLAPITHHVSRKTPYHPEIISTPVLMQSDSARNTLFLAVVRRGVLGSRLNPKITDLSVGCARNAWCHFVSLQRYVCPLILQNNA